MAESRVRERYLDFLRQLDESPPTAATTAVAQVFASVANYMAQEDCCDACIEKVWAAAEQAAEAGRAMAAERAPVRNARRPRTQRGT
jgi:hypothetical protein